MVAASDRFSARTMRIASARPLRRTLTIVALTCSLLGLQVPDVHAASPTPFPPDTILKFRGKGWGHGRGMGQWGAKGMADSGSDYTQILNHYYRDVSHGDRGNPNLRVLVESSQDVIVTSTEPFKVKYANGTLAREAPANSFWRITYSGGKYKYSRSDRWNGSWESVLTDSRYAIFSIKSGLLEVVRNSGSVRRYRGSIIARWSESDGMRAINSVPMEDYLRGVVPRESPSSWPAEALEAQSVAARTYAFRYRDASRAKGNTFDICSTTSCQVYEGHSGRSQPGATTTGYEASSTNAAIATTSGEVLTYNSEPILAEFSSSTGGYTAPGNVPYQKAVPDPGDGVSPHHSWSADIPVTDIESRWPKLGRLARIDFLERNGFGEWGGRVKRLALVGTTSTIEMTGDAFRSAFAWPSGGEVRSSWFTVGTAEADRVKVPRSTSMTQGSSKTLLYRYRNTGSDVWAVGGDLQIETDPGSQVRHANWISDTIVARVDRNVTRDGATLIKPDEVAEFRVSLDGAGVNVGTYQLPLRLKPSEGLAIDSSILKITIVSPWLERSPNLLTSGSFEKGWQTWTRSLGKRDGFGPGRDGNQGLVLVGEGRRTVEQTVMFAGGAARSFQLGAWVKTGKAAVNAVLIVAYQSGPIEKTSLAKWGSGSSWTYKEGGFTSADDRELRSVTVRLVADLEESGWANLDVIRLIEESVQNASFERGSLGPWNIQEPAGETPPRTAGWTAQDGLASLMLPGRAQASWVQQRFPLTARPWERLTLRFAERAYAQNAKSEPYRVTITLEHPDGSETSESIGLDKSAHPWRLNGFEIRPTKRVEFARLKIEQEGQTGRAYLDSFRLLRSRLIDPSFEGEGEWGLAGLADRDGFVRSAARDGGSGVRLDSPERSYTTQKFNMRGAPSRQLKIGFFHVVSAPRSTLGRVEVVVTFFHQDGSSNSRRILLSGSTHPWRWSEEIVGSTERYEHVRISVSSRSHPGTAFVDQVLVTEA